MVTKSILFEYFNGNSSVLQKRMIENWLEKGQNSNLYYEWLAEWESEYPQYVPDVENKIDEYLSKIEHAKKIKLIVTNKKELKPSYKNYRILAYAASIVIVLSLLFSLLPISYIFNKQISTDYGEIKQVKLPDGSELTLYSNSKLTWNGLNFENQRIVYLDGEANFDIKYNQEASKFKVKTKNEVTIIVYGTEFRFFTRERGSKVELNKGVIKLHYKEGKSKKTIALKPGESISLNKENKLTERSTFEPSRNIELKKHRFTFDNTPLSELKILIPEYFGLGIVITDKEIEKLTLTGTYTGNSLNELINSLSAVTGLNFYKYHGRIYIVPY
ncbi:MAG: FecR domain-containing protein [Saprospiraceae bacterium]|nr:FecR domain-containing protein [Saprospiraceae bacterium]MDP4912825.1 FecR domain-containing protein [Saprospiraceae bacterium]